jgi:hypothetical protein
MTIRDLHDHERGLRLAASAVDYELTRAESAELDALLAACPTCARRAAAIRSDALALGRPLPLLPSPRVDAAVHAEIARRSARPDRIVLVAAAALLLLTLLGVAAVGSYLAREWQTPPITVVPQPTDRVALTSPRPAPSPSAGPTATASPSGPIASTIDPLVLLRVNIVSDTHPGRYPSMTVYGDGSVVSRGGQMTRLTPAGLERLMAPAVNSDLLVASGELDIDPAYVGGVPTWMIDLRRSDVIIRRSTTHSEAVVPSQRIEAERIIALVEQLAGRESWLPADAWATAPIAGARYVPARFLVVTRFEDGPGRTDLALDVADVDWPLGGRLEDFGTALGPAVDGESSRCGLVTLPEALAVQQALTAAPVRPDGEDLDADLDWASAGRHVTVSLVPLLPDDPADCAVAG